MVCLIGAAVFIIFMLVICLIVNISWIIDMIKIIGWLLFIAAICFVTFVLL